MASSVSGPEPVSAPIRRLRICRSPGRLIPGLQPDSGSDLNRTGTITRVPGRRWSTAATELAASSRKINLQRASGGLKVEQTRLYARQLPVLKLAGETARKHFKLRTTSLSSLSSFQWGAAPRSDRGEANMVSRHHRSHNTFLTSDRSRTPAGGIDHLRGRTHFFHAVSNSVQQCRSN